MIAQFLSEFIQSAAAAFAVWRLTRLRLTRLRLTRRFPALIVFLVFFAVSATVFAVVDYTTSLYYWLFIFYTPLQSILSIIAVRELFGLIFEDYPGIQTIGRWAMYAGIVLSVVSSLVIAVAFSQGGTGSNKRLFYTEVVQRYVVFGTAVVIATILVILSRYPLRPGKNTWYSILCFSAFFISEAARLLIDSLAFLLHIPAVDYTENVLTTVIFVVWASLLVPEPAPKLSRIHFSVTGEKHLTDQLESLNRLLGRAGER
jgi:hypothetical protein